MSFPAPVLGSPRALAHARALRAHRSSAFTPARPRSLPPSFSRLARPLIARTPGSSFHYPKQVFSAAGGWFNREPPGWQRATMGAFAIMGGCAAAGFAVSAARERRPTPPLWPIASQGWSAHAKEDDPSRR